MRTVFNDVKTEWVAGVGSTVLLLLPQVRWVKLRAHCLEVSLYLVGGESGSTEISEVSMVFLVFLGRLGCFSGLQGWLGRLEPQNS